MEVGELGTVWLMRPGEFGRREVNESMEALPCSYL